VTTRWDEAGNDRAVELERELMMGERYFKPLRRAGARMFSHDNTSASARRVVNMLLNNDPAPLQMQIELARPGATIEQTAAGSQLNTDLDAIAKKHNAEMKKVREEMEEAAKAKDQAWQKELNDELAMLREDAKRNAESKEQLRQLPSKAGVFGRVIHAGAEGARHPGLLQGMLGGGSGSGGSPARRTVAQSPLRPP